jgi:hypothetical protein
VKLLSKTMKYSGEEEREIPRYGVFKPGDVVEYNESLHGTGLFRVGSKKNDKKDGDK